MSEKTEKPTPKKLQDSRKKGQVAKSKEIATTAVIVALLSYFWGFFGEYRKRLEYVIEAPTEYFDQPFDLAVIAMSKTVVQEFAIMIFPFVAVAVVTTILAYMIQIGFIIAFEPIKPDIKKVDPVQGVKRIFSLNNLFELAKSIVKILLIGSIFYLILKSNMKNLLYLHRGDQELSMKLLAGMLKKVTVSVSSLFIVVAIIDHFLQKWLHVRKLKMSKDEVKREHKDREGDPHFKGHRMQLQREIAEDDMASKVKNAMVVLADSKKKVIVLFYDMNETPLPVITVKGKNAIARKVISMAKEYNTPVRADAGLTQKLYKSGQQDNYIPTELLDPVADVIRDYMGAEE